jgi:hypothetical protein
MVRVWLVVEGGHLSVAAAAVQMNRFSQSAVGFETRNARPSLAGRGVVDRRRVGLAM